MKFLLKVKLLKRSGKRKKRKICDILIKFKLKKLNIYFHEQLEESISFIWKIEY